MMFDLLIQVLATTNEILAAGILITSASLLLYSLTFNLRVPVSYLHLADALLATTGRPSRGRRRAGIRLFYLVSTLFMLAAAFSDLLVHGPVAETLAAAPHLLPGPLFWTFAVYFAGTCALAASFVWRAYRRCITSTTRRRMGYLLLAGVAPALGSFPYWLLAGNVAPPPLGFWTASIVINLLVAVLLTAMAYIVAFFGVTQPDRVVRSRLFQWLLRGPVVASTVLMMTLLVGRYGGWIGVHDARAVPFFMVGTLLLLQFFITLVRVPLEGRLFYGEDRADVQRLQQVASRLLTRSDLQQFFESVLAAICDQLRISSAFVAAVGENGLELEVAVGLDDSGQRQAELPPLPNPEERPTQQQNSGLFLWGDYRLLPLRPRPGRLSPDGQREAGPAEAIGLLGLRAPAAAPDFSPEEEEVLRLLTERIVAALEDRRLQREVFGALDNLIPSIDQIQRLRAAARYSGAAALTAQNGLPPDVDLARGVRDALTHYWGGPRLTNNPLMRLKVVERALRQHAGNPVDWFPWG
ncbi:MAG: hypothetical protein HY784_13150, partial [Chloroflexi bacterium]|nr:hypothetical protein [Chloroflexota bacterium]